MEVYQYVLMRAICNCPTRSQIVEEDIVDLANVLDRIQPTSQVYIVLQWLGTINVSSVLKNRLNL